jgi:hypothetical protein
MMESKTRKSHKITKYLVPQACVLTGNNEIELQWKQRRLDGQGFNLTIKNFLSKPVEGMYVLPKQTTDDGFRVSQAISSLLVGLLYACAMILYSILLLRRSPIETKRLFVIDIIAASPAILLYSTLLAAGAFFPRTITLGPSFYFVPFFALYFKSAYPLLRQIAKVALFKKGILVFGFLLVGCMLCLMAGLQSCARPLADGAFIFLGIGIALGFTNHYADTFSSPRVKSGIPHAARDIALLFTASLIPLLWFKQGHFIAGGDIAAFIGLDNYIQFLPYAWDEQVMAGRHNFAPHFMLPYGAFWFIFKTLSVPGNIIELLWACTTLFVSSLSMYYLIGTLAPGPRGTWGRLIGSLFYIINPFLANIPLFTQYNLAPIYMCTPLMLAFFAQGLQAARLSGRFLFASLIALCSQLFASASLNITHLLVLGLLLFLYFAFFICAHRARAGAAFVFVSFCAGLYLLTNLWWLSISFTKMVSMSGTVAQSHGGWEVLNAARLFDAFRLLGSWAWRAGHRDLLYFPYFDVYDRWYFVLAEFGLVIFIFSGLWRRTRTTLFAGLLALTALFFIKGSTGPLGSVYAWMWKTLPGFWIFREPFAKFMPLLTVAYALLLAVSCDLSIDALHKRIQDYRKRLGNAAGAVIAAVPDIIPILLVALLALVSFPMITGQCIWDHFNGEMRSLHVKVPDYWYTAADWFKKNDPAARVLPLPKTGYGKSCFNWESGFNAECSPVKNLFPNPLIYFEDFPHNRYQQFLNGAFDVIKTSPRPSGTLRLLGIGYVLHQRDVDWRFTWPDAVPPQQLQEVLQKDPELKLVQSFGKLDIYKVTDPLPMIYSAAKATFISESDQNLFTMNPETLDREAPYVFTGDQPAFSAVSISPAAPPAAAPGNPIKHVEKINPAKYVVHIDTDQPFWLIFNNTFSPEWKAYTVAEGKTGMPMLKKRVFLAALFHQNRCQPLNAHCVVNGFANGWRVEKTGAYTVVIHYQPQCVFEAAIYISFASIIILLLYAFIVTCGKVRATGDKPCQKKPY